MLCIVQYGQKYMEQNSMLYDDKRKSTDDIGREVVVFGFFFPPKFNSLKIVI